MFSIHLQDHPEVKIAHQVLIYPSMRLTKSEHTESYKKYRNGYLLFEAATSIFREGESPSLLFKKKDSPLETLHAPSFNGY